MRKHIKVLGPVGGKEEIRELADTIRSGWWGRGPKVDRLEKAFAKLVGCKYAVAVNHCTGALHLALEVLGIHNKEVVVPTITFVAPAMVPYYCNSYSSGLSTVLADVKEEDYCIDPAKLPLSKETGAVIVVHEAGALADIKSIKKRFGGPIIEDCAHACFTEGVGSKGRNIGCWSFQAVKTLPAGDGGMITTNNREVARKVFHMSWNGIGRSTWDRAKGRRYTWDYRVYGLGWKYYMNDITAAIALQQLKKLKKNLAWRHKIAKIYDEELKDHLIPAPKSGTYQYYVARVKNRDRIADYLATKGVATSVHFKPVHLFPFFKGCTKGPLSVAEKVWKEFLSLPMYVGLTTKDVRYVVKHIKKAVREV